MLLSRFAAALDPFDDRCYSHPTVVDHTAGMMPRSEDSAFKNSVIWRAANVLGGAIGSVPAGVFRDLGGERGKEAATDDPWHVRFKRGVSRSQTAYRFFHQMAGQVMVGGNFYARRIGTPLQPGLWPLPADRVRVAEVLRDGGLRYEYRNSQGQPEILEQSEIVHIRGFSRDGLTGCSVFEMMRDELGLALAGRTQRTAFMRNEMRPGVVIKHPSTLTSGAEANIVKGYVNTHGGPHNAGLPLVLAEGADIATFSVSARDSQWIEGEEFNIQNFIRWTGIPGVLLGYPDKTATYASAEAFFDSFISFCLLPFATNIEREFSLALWGLDSPLSLEFNLNALMRADSAARATFYRTMVEMGILTRNEVRRLENRNPLPGLDDPLTPKNMGTGADTSEPPPAPPRRPPGAKSRARLRQFVRGAAARIVRREALHLAGSEGQKGLAVRFAADPKRWAAAVADFYERHAEMVENELHLSADAAAGYCREQREAVLAGGMAVVATWESDRVAHLERLALGGVAC